MRVGKPVRRSLVSADIEGLLGGARDDIGRYRASLGLVAVEQALVSLAAQDERQLPGEVVGVLDAGIHPLPARRRVDMGGVAGDEGRSDPVAGGKPHADAEDRRPAHVLQRGLPRQQAIGDLLQVGERRVGPVALDAMAGARSGRGRKALRRDHRNAVTTMLRQRGWR